MKQNVFQLQPDKDKSREQRMIDEGRISIHENGAPIVNEEMLVADVAKVTGVSPAIVELVIKAEFAYLEQLGL